MFLDEVLVARFGLVGLEGDVVFGFEFLLDRPRLLEVVAVVRERGCRLPAEIETSTVGEVEHRVRVLAEAAGEHGCVELRFDSSEDVEGLFYLLVEIGVVDVGVDVCVDGRCSYWYGYL